MKYKKQSIKKAAFFYHLFTQKKGGPLKQKTTFN